MMDFSRQSSGSIQSGVKSILCIEQQTNQRIPGSIGGGLFLLRKQEQAGAGFDPRWRLAWLNFWCILVRQGFPFIQVLRESIQAECNSTDDQVGEGVSW